MSPTRSLLWKEWSEVRVFVYIAMFVFLGLPLIGALQTRYQTGRFELLTSMWVMMFGGVLAVVVGTGLVVRDLNGRLEQFWRSRPVSVTRWILVKYFIGLIVVLTSLLVPLWIEYIVDPRSHLHGRDSDVTIFGNVMLWCSAYSVSFVVASLIRRGAHAAMVSVALMLVMIFLPLIIPPLRPLSIEHSVDTGSIMSGLAAIVAGICMVCLLLAVLSARRDWRIESGRKTIYWSFAAGAILLFWSMMYQVGTNLPVLSKTARGVTLSAQQIHTDGRRVLVVASHESDNTYVHSYHLGPAGLQPTDTRAIAGYAYGTVWRSDHPTLLYALQTIRQPDEELYVSHVVVIDLATGEVMPVDGTRRQFNRNGVWSATLYVWQDRLYLVNDQVVIFELSSPRKPRWLSTDPLPFVGMQTPISDSDHVVILPQVPGLPPRQRLDLALKHLQFDGNLLVAPFDQRLRTFELDSLTEERATFRLVGRHEPTPVQLMFGGSIHNYAVANGLCYGIQGSRLTVFDITKPNARPIAHYATANDYPLLVHPLSDGSCLLVCMNHVYHLGSPSVHP